MIAFSLRFIEFLYHGDDFFEYFGAVLLDITHKFPQFFILRLGDDESIGILKKAINLASKFRMSQQSMTDLEIAVVLVFSPLVLSEKLDDILVALQVFTLELLKPTLSVLHVELLESHLH
jgi:hypothetical protein